MANRTNYQSGANNPFEDFGGGDSSAGGGDDARYAALQQVRTLL